MTSLVTLGPLRTRFGALFTSETLALPPATRRVQPAVQSGVVGTALTVLVGRSKGVAVGMGVQVAVVLAIKVGAPVGFGVPVWRIAAGSVGGTKVLEEEGDSTLHADKASISMNTVTVDANFV